MSQTITVLAPAKLNLFLHVVGRRPDGYHLLQTVFVLIDLADSIRFTRRNDGAIRRVSDLSGVSEADDLVVRAAVVLKRAAERKFSTADGGKVPGTDIAVEKRIPMGGGLGGGSSDAASTLITLNEMWKLDFSRQELREFGLTLGADVPFFVFGQDAFAEGVGERLQAVTLPQWWYVVLTPPVSVPTPFVFGHAELTRSTFPLKITDFSARGLVNTQNDLQRVVLKEFPVVSDFLEALQAASQKSVFGARMTGSGGCVFAAFEIERDARTAFQKLRANFNGFVARGLSRHEMFAPAR